MAKLRVPQLLCKQININSPTLPTHSYYIIIIIIIHSSRVYKVYDIIIYTSCTAMIPISPVDIH